jgi:hypothetical protein
MIDRDLITRKLALIAADVKALAPFAAKNLSEYLRSDLDEPAAPSAKQFAGRAVHRWYNSSQSFLSCGLSQSPSQKNGGVLVGVPPGP